MVLLNGLFLDTNLIIIPEKHDNFGKQVSGKIASKKEMIKMFII